MVTGAQRGAAEDSEWNNPPKPVTAKIRMMEETGCDAVMIARGALGNPWIFSEAIALWHAGWKPGQGDPDAQGCLCASPTNDERIQTLIRHLKMLAEDKGEHVAVCEIRKFVGPYTKGMHGAATIRREANGISSVEEMIELLKMINK